jgi:hypothetical protein
MKFKNLIIRNKTEKFIDLGAPVMQEMKEFYLVLLKIQKKRPQFDVNLVMKEVYSESVFRKFIFYFYNQ